MADQTNKFFYPVTPETLHQYAASIFAPIRRGECVTTVWVPMAGRRMWNKFIIENIPLFAKELPNYQKYLLVYIEPLDLMEESLPGYLRLMGKSFMETCRRQGACKDLVGSETGQVFSNDQATYTKLLEALKSLLQKATELGLDVVFFLGEFDELKFANTIFYHNLKSLWDSLKPKLHYIFLSIEDLSSSEVTDRFGELNAATLENIVYTPLGLDSDIEYFTDFFSERLDKKFSPEEKKLLRDICGGHPYLIKVAAKVLVSIPNLSKDISRARSVLENHYEMLLVARRIFKLRTKTEQEIMQSIANNKPVSFSIDLQRLMDLGLIKKDPGGHPALFAEILIIAAKERHEIGEPVVNINHANLHLGEGGEVLLNGGITVDEKFTRQEYEVVKLLLKETGKLRSRDEVSEVLWGKDSYEKYSDWAIDQIMSKIRKKLKELEAKTELITVRGRGYKLASKI